jgi:predicted Zn-dependent peptidase
MNCTVGCNDGSINLERGVSKEEREMGRDQSTHTNSKRRRDQTTQNRTYRYSRKHVRGVNPTHQASFHRELSDREVKGWRVGHFGPLNITYWSKGVGY